MHPPILRSSSVRSVTRRLALGGVLLIATASTGRAQEARSQLGITGTMTYNALWYEDFEAWGVRFAGRVALPVVYGLYTGLAVGSWLTVTGGSCSLDLECDEVIGGQREAVVVQLYGQFYVHDYLAVRTGFGIGTTRSLLAEGPNAIRVLTRARPALSVGVLGDFPLRRPVYLTPSLDVITLFGTDRLLSELRQALAVGIGVTVR